jgi:hypothetical protein
MGLQWSIMVREDGPRFLDLDGADLLNHRLGDTHAMASGKDECTHSISRTLCTYSRVLIIGIIYYSNALTKCAGADGFRASHQVAVHQFQVLGRERKGIMLYDRLKGYY